MTNAKRALYAILLALLAASLRPIPESALAIGHPRKKAPKDTPAVAGAVKENSKDGLKYVWIGPGTFQMGCSAEDKQCDGDEKPLHQVAISRGFWMGQTEVTVRAYKLFVSGTGRAMPPPPEFNADWADDVMPMVNLTWGNAHDYCQWAGGRLPTEAEWEYAARAGNSDARYGPLDDVAWDADNSGRRRLDSYGLWTADEQKYRDRPNADQEQYYKGLSANGNRPHEVAKKRANAFGLFDTLGNVWEWVDDWFDVYYYKTSPGTDPPGPSTGAMRVLRSGSYLGNPAYVRVSFRYGVDPTLRYNFVGTRCALPAGEP